MVKFRLRNMTNNAVMMTNNEMETYYGFYIMFIFSAFN